jgi:hypothetical protein
VNNHDFSSSLQSAGFIREEFNSNNPQGYGGAVGLRFTRGDTVVTSARACCRVARYDADFVSVALRGHRVYGQRRSASSLGAALELALAN